jgi:hypothetical protein
MDPRQGNRGRTRLPLGFLGAFALVACIEWSVARHGDRFAGSGPWANQVAAERASTSARDYQVLVFGDSLLKLGLASRVIEARTSLPTYNFSIAGAQAPTTFYLMKRALEVNPRPRAIVVDFFSNLLAKDVRFNTENYPFLLNQSEILELARVSRDAHLFADLMIRRLVPSIRYRTGIRLAIELELRGYPETLRTELLKSSRNWSRNGGAEIAPSRPGFNQPIDKWCSDYFERFACTETNRHYIEKSLDLAASRGIPVFWLIPPVKPEVQAHCVRTGLDAAVTAFAADLQKKFANLIIIDGRRCGYDPAVFHDHHHLGREGAVAFTMAVSDCIMRSLAETEPRSLWVHLPAYQSLGSPVPLEDVDESRAIVQRQVAERLVR